MTKHDEDEEREMTRDEIKVWRCECGASPEEIVWTEIVSYLRKWDGERFVSIREEANDVEFTCGKCGAMVPRPDEDVMNEALNN